MCRSSAIHTLHATILFAAAALLWLAPANSRAVTVPVEVATGPSFFQLDHPRFGGEPNALVADQPWHFGWRLEIAAVIDREWAREHPGYVPPQFRERLAELGEVRYSPAVLSLLPRSLFISPKIWDTGMYGATWEFLHAGISAGLGSARAGIGGGLVFSYAFMHSDTLPSPYHFLRPGLNVGASIYLPLAETAGFSIGWDSHVYVPQAIGGGIFEFAGDRGTLWHVGEAYLMFHYVFPYSGGF